MIDAVLDERKARRDAAAAEITAAWGLEQEIIGPILVVPVVPPTGPLTDLYLLPESLTVETELSPGTRHRGIYEVTVYGARVALSGRFTAPDHEALAISPSWLDWDSARIALSVTDLRGADGALDLRLGDALLPFRPGTELPSLPLGVHARLEGPLTWPVEFSTELTLNGTGGMSFAPLGVETRVRVTSS
jgi:inner membrane protein